MQYSQRPTEWQLYFHNSIPDIICIKDDSTEGLSFTLKVRDVLVLEERYSPRPTGYTPYSLFKYWTPRCWDLFPIPTLVFLVPIAIGM